MSATTAAWPMSKGASAVISSSPWAMSARSRGDGWQRPNTPSGAMISGATSSTPTTCTPPSSIILATAVSSRLSPPRNARAIRGRRRRVAQSSRIALSGGRNRVPMMTTSRHPSLSVRRRNRPSWPIAIQWCAWRSTTAGSAQPRSANSTGRRPARLIASATAPGKLPPPQMTPIEPPGETAATGYTLEAPPSRFIVVAFAALMFHTRLHQWSLSAGAGEGDDFADERVVGKIAGNASYSVGKHAAAQKHRLVGAAQRMQVGSRRTAPSQADGIEADQRRYLAEGESKWNDVRRYAAEPGNHCALADTHKLMHGALTAEKNIVSDADVAAEHSVVGERDIVTDGAVVPDMGTDHKQAALADSGHSAAGFGAGIDRDMFAQLTMRAYDQFGRTAAVMN